MSPSRRTRVNRRQLVASSVVGGAAILATGQALRAGTDASQPATILAQETSSDVPMFRGNAARTGEMPGPGPDYSNGVEVIWTLSLGEVEFGSNLAVVDGVVFAGTDSGALYAVNAADGKERWQFPAYAEAPAVVDGVVYAGSDNGEFYALNMADGTERWRFTAAEDRIDIPAVVDGVVYAGSENGDFYALNTVDGTERWRFTTAVDQPGILAVVNDVVYIGGSGETLYALNAEDGTERWRFTTSSDGTYTPAVLNGVVYFGSFISEGAVLYALNAEDGTERWRFTTSSNGIYSPAVVDGMIYVGSDNGVLYAVNAEDGTERWRIMLTDSSIDDPVVVDGTVYFGSSYGAATLYAVSADNGAELWRFKTVDWIYPWAVVNGVVYATGDGDLYAIGARVPKLSAGGTARVTETTSLRGGPVATAVERMELEAETVVTITAESVTTDDIVWWPVKVDESGAQGWIEASKLEPLTSGPEATETT